MFRCFLRELFCLFVFCLDFMLKYVPASHSSIKNDHVFSSYIYAERESKSMAFKGVKKNYSGLAVRITQYGSLID